jgi:myo-inositol 2-dehydrogenase / D-chiro-inositol 1-dehydrogenase
MRPALIQADHRPARAARALERDRALSTQELLAAGHHYGSTFFQHQAFQLCIRDGTPPEVSLEDGRMAVAMGAAAERSIRERMPIPF